MRVTAAGSLPGDDFRGALGAVTEVLPDILPLPELPGRGVGSQMVGRTLGLIDGLGFDLQPAGWRLTTSSGSGADHRRARSQWRFDLDDAEELLQGFGGVLKVAVAGPWTLAASVERPTGDRLLADHGARREMAQALAHGVGSLFADLSRRLPETTLRLQVDEPLVVSVAEAQVPTASGFSRHRRVHAPELSGALSPLIAIDRDAILHCCADGAWLPLARSAGFASASLDLTLFETGRLRDVVGQWLADDLSMVLGVVDTARHEVQSADDLVTRALGFLRPLGLDPEVLRDRVVLGTACGLAGWSLPDAMAQLEQLRRAGELIDEQLER
ncbi:uroporphyrinogen decarboxylase/cobalamine-independent methonine synthase family protein [Tessaracoccus antarcticus]|uniref:Methionine synthase n=1 Tax=Tessaracoccus antarcticus TaxID=2479848 RepID=A0A3M0G409_9ACTN|nr:methionine synthase [Tessaracoccus antarcticus]RMB58807.1 methionine synthase [Tessaracoccus antarcticus]